MCSVLVLADGLNNEEYSFVARLASVAWRSSQSGRAKKRAREQSDEGEKERWARGCNPAHKCSLRVEGTLSYYPACSNCHPRPSTLDQTVESSHRLACMGCTVSL